MFHGLAGMNIQILISQVGFSFPKSQKNATQKNYHMILVDRTLTLCNSVFFIAYFNKGEKLKE